MELIEILTQAMELEKDGREYYLKAAETVADEQSQTMFRQLAKDELDHYNYIERQYAALQCGEDVCAIAELEAVDPVDLKDPIFPPEAKGVEDQTLYDTLLFALTAEDKSYRLYRDGGEAVDNAEAKQLFFQLAAAEMRHFETLLQRYESIFGYPM